ncbi:MAG: peptidyl-prolyl cis-trans isomerase [Polyangiaceae bacterium]
MAELAGSGRRRAVAIVVAATGSLLCSMGLAGDGPLTVGPTTFSAAELQTYVNRIPAFQLKGLGSTPAAIKRAVADEVAGAELFALGARDAGLHERPDVHDRIRSVYVSALLQDIRREAEEAGEVSDEEVRAYYEENKDRFESQQRIKIWQIVVDSPEKVKTVYDAIESEAYAKDPAATWDQLAREHSIDKTTAMRKGNIGFVQPDGSTAHKDVRVPKEMYEAALTVADGEVLKKPLKVGDYFVIIQRRGTMNTPERTLGMETPTIRGLLSKRKIGARRKALVQALRDRYVEELNPRAVNAIEVTPSGELSQKSRPGTLQRATHGVSGATKPTGKPGRMR